MIRRILYLALQNQTLSAIFSLSNELLFLLVRHFVLQSPIADSILPIRHAFSLGIPTVRTVYIGVRTSVHIWSCYRNIKV